MDPVRVLFPDPSVSVPCLVGNEVSPEHIAGCSGLAPGLVRYRGMRQRGSGGPRFLQHQDNPVLSNDATVVSGSHEPETRFVPQFLYDPTPLLGMQPVVSDQFGWVPTDNHQLGTLWDGTASEPVFPVAVLSPGVFVVDNQHVDREPLKDSVACLVRAP